ncbi:hypothetical protein C8R46DRAFT_984966 [Mycena filopes]|nr:hypothetical protein C8R46DRAFT_984966 [Mycena filopes]
MSSLEETTDHKPIVLPPGATLPPGVGEYEAGRVICEVCGNGVSFRDDEAGGGFTLRHWEAHRSSWFAHHHHHPQQANLHPVQIAYTSHHGSQQTEQPPAKRRRAKRTEEERIEYLRADAHVAQFEAYRVLCASCDKWIRLRPNSTYCSIPWDAHRKSCLAKKSNAKNVYALEERNAMFTKDPDVRKFDSERILCGMCDKWLSTPTDDHLGAVQVWVQHRAACQKTVSALKNRKPVIDAPPHSNGNGNASAGPSHRASPNTRQQQQQQHPNLAQQQQHPHSAPPSTAHPSHTRSGPNGIPTHLPLPDAPHLLLDLSPANYAAPHESRRRNAEQRAATLRADVLIREVEPNRVFCSLCTKWVQLRQDSSYCAYPWLQHRGKCLARYQRRAQKASDIASSMKGKRGPRGEHGEHRTSEDGDEPESEESMDPTKQRQGHPHAQHPAHHRQRGPPAQQHPPRAIPVGYAAARPMKEWAAAQQQRDREAQMQQQQREREQQGDDLDAEGEADDVDADGDSYMEEDGATPTPARAYAANGGANGAYGNHGGHGHHQQHHNGNGGAIGRRAVPASLADLDSQGGRRAFVFASVEYLFRTTYEASDDMSVSALLTYLNAAMPTDKHEDFDTGEVVRAASALAAREKGRFALEGDMIRLLCESG